MSYNQAAFLRAWTFSLHWIYWLFFLLKIWSKWFVVYVTSCFWTKDFNVQKAWHKTVVIYLSDTNSLSIQVSFVTQLHSKACLSWLFPSQLQFYNLENRMKVSKVWYFKKELWEDEALRSGKNSGLWEGSDRYFKTPREECFTFWHEWLQ